MPIIIMLVVGALVCIGIGYWIGTLPQRALAAEKKAEMARRRNAQEALIGADLAGDTDDYG